jgi:hypothetical protein
MSYRSQPASKVRHTAIKMVIAWSGFTVERVPIVSRG